MPAVLRPNRTAAARQPPVMVRSAGPTGEWPWRSSRWHWPSAASAPRRSGCRRPPTATATSSPPRSTSLGSTAHRPTSATAPTAGRPSIGKRCTPVPARPRVRAALVRTATVGDQGVPIRQVAETIAGHLGVPARVGRTERDRPVSGLSRDLLGVRRSRVRRGDTRPARLAADAARALGRSRAGPLLHRTAPPLSDPTGREPDFTLKGVISRQTRRAPQRQRTAGPDAGRARSDRAHVHAGRVDKGPVGSGPVRWFASSSPATSSRSSPSSGVAAWP